MGRLFVEDDREVGQKGEKRRKAIKDICLLYGTEKLRRAFMRYQASYRRGLSS